MALATTNAQLITDETTLRDCLKRAATFEWIALDTEFMREQNYYPQLSLVQIAAGEEIFLIDPLAIDDLSALRDLLQDSDTLKVLHAADQDIEVLIHATGATVQPLFDTQLAAMLLGHGDQIGYAPAVQCVLGQSLGKTHQRTDWSRRPLDQQELNYAADDVRYLAPMYQALHADLKSRGRADWLANDFARLSDPNRYQITAESAWRKVKGLGKLRPVEQHRAARLAAWREERAQNMDRPRRWILKDDVLLDIAKRNPKSGEALGRIRGMPDKLSQKPAEILKLCAEPAASEQALITNTDRPSPEQKPIVDALSTLIQATAIETGIAAAALAGRKELEQLVMGNQDLPVLDGWRREAVGNALLAMLEGKISLHIEQDQVVVNRL